MVLLLLLILSRSHCELLQCLLSCCCYCCCYFPCCICYCFCYRKRFLLFFVIAFIVVFIFVVVVIFVFSFCIFTFCVLLLWLGTTAAVHFCRCLLSEMFAYICMCKCVFVFVVPPALAARAWYAPADMLHVALTHYDCGCCLCYCWRCS